MLSTPSTSPAPPHIELLRRLVCLGPLCASDTTTHQLSLPTTPSDISPLASFTPVGDDATVRSHIQLLVSAASTLVGTVPASPRPEATGCAPLPPGLNLATSSSASTYPLRTPLQPYIRLLRSLAALDPPCAAQIPDDYPPAVIQRKIAHNGRVDTAPIEDSWWLRPHEVMILRKCPKSDAARPNFQQVKQPYVSYSPLSPFLSTLALARGCRSYRMANDMLDSTLLPLAERRMHGQQMCAAIKSDATEDSGLFSCDAIRQNLVFLVFLPVQNRLQENAPRTVYQFRGAGVVVRMVSDDNASAAGAIATECGILTPHGIFLEGGVFQSLDDERVVKILPRLQVLVRASPSDKRRLVSKLKELGKVSMGIRASAMVTESSSIVLTDSSLLGSTLKALMRGRSLNDSVKKAIHLATDTAAVFVLTSEPPTTDHLDRPPHRRDASQFTFTMWKMVLGQIAIQLTTAFALYYTGAGILSIHRKDPDQILELKTTVFHILFLTQTFGLINNRQLRNRLNIFRGLFRDYFFVTIIHIVIGAQIMIVYTGGRVFSLHPKVSAACDGPSVSWSLRCPMPFAAMLRLMPDVWFRVVVKAVAFPPIAHNQMLWKVLRIWRPRTVQPSEGEARQERGEDEKNEAPDKHADQLAGDNDSR
ncbi:hypothetical protein CHU98_g7305 [Xylaria longipes]|nr:hypothetical protein CHU98_g7305 [Xylaria longipes]